MEERPRVKPTDDGQGGPGLVTYDVCDSCQCGLAFYLSVFLFVCLSVCDHELNPQTMDKAALDW